MMTGHYCYRKWKKYQRKKRTRDARGKGPRYGME